MEIDFNKYSSPMFEEVVIAHLLQNKNIDTITSEIKEEFFTDEFFKNIFILCRDYILGAGRGLLDFNAFLDMLTRMGKAFPENIAHLQELRTRDLYQYPLVGYMATQLKDFCRRRKYIIVTNKHLQAAIAGTETIDKILLDHEEELLDIEKSEGNQLELITGEQIITRRKQGIIKRVDTPIIISHWDNLDARLTYGYAPGKVSVVAGRTSMGKSMFKTNLICNMCKNEVGVLSICPEQGFDSEHDRIDAVLTGIPLREMAQAAKWDFNYPEANAKFELLTSASYTISHWNYSCVPSRNITVAGIQSAIRRFKRMGKKIDVVFVDLFDRLMDVNVARDRTANFSVKLAQIARIADEEQVHMCLLVQINRGTEGRKDHRPTLGDLRDCGNFEQDSDLVILLYREGYYDSQIDDNMLEANIAKQRDGISGVTPQFIIIDKNILQIVPAGERIIPRAEDS